MANLSEQILGTWIGISHQSITVITYNQDGTLFGTYQTPSINLKTTYDGFVVEGFQNIAWASCFLRIDEGNRCCTHRSVCLNGLER
jgi:hypothetical protein